MRPYLWRPELDVMELERLVTKARHGDSDALACLCSAFYARILKYMRYRTDEATAMDLTATTFLKVVRGIDSQNGSFHAWIYRIARNVVTDHARKRKVRQEQPMDEQTVDSALAQADPATTVARQEDLRAAIAQLTDEQRELVTLKFIEGMSNNEIAEIMGLNHGAIRALQFRALSALRNILGKEAGHE